MEEVELLRWAAKAAEEAYFVGSYGAMYVEDQPGSTAGHHRYWNPLTDSGDAMRLASKLCVKGKLRIQITHDCIDCFYDYDGVWVPVTWYFDDKGPEAAMRRAIVRAAYEIGKLMK